MKKLFLFAIAVLLTQASMAQTSTWTGASTVPSNDLWSNAGNWSPSGVPSSSTNVTIPTVSRPPRVTATALCQWLTLSTTSASLTITGANAKLTVGKTVGSTTTGSVTNSGSITISSGGTLSTLNGVLLTNNITSSIKATITINSKLEARGGITNNGTITSGSSGVLDLLNTAATTISGSGTTSLTNLNFSNFASNSISSTMSNPVTVSQVAKVQAYDVNTNGKLKLTSNSASTGLIWNAGNGKITGEIIVQRYVDSLYNRGAGYRHYSSPVSPATFSELSTTGYHAFTPLIEPTYAYPGNQTPNGNFPNIFYFDQSLITLNNSTYTAWAYAWRCPGATTDTMHITKAYAVRTYPVKVSLTGKPHTGSVSSPGLGVGTSGGSIVYWSGWHLVGNPYPSPIDAFSVMLNNTPNFRASIAINHSTSLTGGRYSILNNGDANTDSIAQFLPIMQGFFVQRDTSSRNTGTQTYNFTDFDRKTENPATGLTPFYRMARPVFPRLELALLNNQSRDQDLTAVSFRPEAKNGYDSQYDAPRPPDNDGTCPTLYTVSEAHERCAINAYGPLTTSTVVPVGMKTLIPGNSYTLRLSKLNNFDAATRVFLEDRLAGRTKELKPQRPFIFLADGESYEQRFFLHVEPEGRSLATDANTTELAVDVYPSPAAIGSDLLFDVAGLPRTGGEVTATLISVYGRTVATQQLVAAGRDVMGRVPTTGLQQGVYTLRLTTAVGTVARKVIIR